MWRKTRTTIGGLCILGSLLWLGTGGGIGWAAVLLGVGWMVAPYARIRPARASFELDERGVRMVYGEKVESIEWREIARIDAVTTDDGPWAEDLFFVLRADESNGKGVAVPNDLAAAKELVSQLQARFPDMDNEALIKACGCTSVAMFTLWERSPCAPELAAAPGLT